MTFEDLGLSPQVLSALADAGYTAPTPIQAGAIPHALAGRDVLGIAQTGTGKTASFTLPMIERLARGRARARMPRSLILCPTRELADQVAENVRLYAKNHKLTMALLIGGVAFGPQKDILDRGADILIATPGRLLDHFERGGLLLMGVEILVIDEADRMLDMGFIPDIERIVGMLPPRRQTLFFSATMPAEIQRLVSTFLNNPERVEVTRPAQTAETITQYLVRVSDNQPKTKRAALRAAINREGVKNGIIFCNRKRDVDIVARSLQRHGFSAAPIHGDLDQSLRMKTLAQFKSGELRLLVASDVAARGLDIPAVSHVFNMDIPRNADDYVHRIGRTGRAGLTGESVTIVTPEDRKSLANVAKLIGGEPKTLELDGTGQAPSAPAKSQETSEADAPEAAANDSAGNDAPARERGEGRSRRRRGGRGRSRDRAQGAGHDKAPAQAPVETVRPDSAPARPREDRPTRGERESEDAAVGFGDHVPEFLLRPAI
ncbi:DEAD/DEAH box helicase [Alkalicaulis satelles]|uniref:DEAD-box ATP-dependent RNA helicase RhpA n=1 Tax=Alkalicaulis satelles TaxID=2609175 RepID=A0A5M6ZMJ4_9PROT|nr:DEAD/DEAH box helicase [Alkalicaulis satelles]KAA5804458.1 DEAD/DEAH box helicase [Alkalicaulis satelles]